MSVVTTGIRKPDDPKQWRYIREVDGYRLEQRQAEMTPREWDVTDANAREAAAREQLDDLDGTLAQWFISPDDNTACLCIYSERKRTEVAQ